MAILPLPLGTRIDWRQEGHLKMRWVFLWADLAFFPFHQNRTRLKYFRNHSFSSYLLAWFLENILKYENKMNPTPREFMACRTLGMGTNISSTTRTNAAMTRKLLNWSAPCLPCINLANRSRMSAPPFLVFQPTSVFINAALSQSFHYARLAGTNLGKNAASRQSLQSRW